MRTFLLRPSGAATPETLAAAISSTNQFDLPKELSWEGMVIMIGRCYLSKEFKVVESDFMQGRLKIALFLFISSVSAAFAQESQMTVQRYLDRAAERIHKGNITKAIEDYNRASELDPSSADVYYQRGIAFEISREREKAVADFTAAIERRPQFTDAYFHLANLNSSFKEYAAAIADLNKIIEIDSRNQIAYLERGRLKHLQGNFDEALKDIEKAIQINPNNDLGRSARELVRSLKGEVTVDEMLAKYDIAFQQNPEAAADIYFARGNLKFVNGRLDGAITDFTRVIEIDGRNIMAYINRGSARHASGLLNEAVADFNRALEINPDAAYAYAGRGLVYLELGNESAAQAEFDQAIKIDISVKQSLTERIKKLKQRLAADKKLPEK